MFTDKDIIQMEARGISREMALAQVGYFKKGFAPVILNRPAIVGDGITRPDPGRLEALVKLFEVEGKKRQLVKFVPASGAATRMFKDLFGWQARLASGIGADELTGNDKVAAEFFSRLTDFAFWDELVLAMKDGGLDTGRVLLDGGHMQVLDYLIAGKGLNYGWLPKGLITFHRYADHCRTAMEEHLAEGALYAKDSARRVHLHFTVSPDHMEKFREKFSAVEAIFSTAYDATFITGYSVQKPATDTLAVDPENRPFREADGSLLFRPGGHGALIENLNELDADIIFVKNIDNVVPDRLKGETIVYKKAIGGLLIEVQQQLYQWLCRIESGSLDQQAYQAAREFAVDVLHLDGRHFSDDRAVGTAQLFDMLNKPVRVCGMVRNEGEPGGGPFWVENPDTGMHSLQIVETSQVDLGQARQVGILNQSSHFNPVDLVCGVRDYKGRKFNLKNFVDPQTGFISEKSKDGKPLKALELPGLWNGSMAGWISLFVEVPLITFNPVKVVNDLLRKEHQQA